MQTTLNRLLQRQAIRGFDPIAPEGHVALNVEQVNGLTQHITRGRKSAACVRAHRKGRAFSGRNGCDDPAQAGT